MYLKTTNIYGFCHICEIVFVKSNKNHYPYPIFRYGHMGIIKNLNVRYRMKLVNFILEKIEENIFDSSTTANKIRGK